MVTLVAPLIGNDVSYVTRITHAIHHGVAGAVLVSLTGDFSCSAHYK